MRDIALNLRPFGRRQKRLIVASFAVLLVFSIFLRCLVAIRCRMNAKSPVSLLAASYIIPLWKQKQDFATLTKQSSAR